MTILCIYKLLFGFHRRYIIFIRKEIDKRNSDVTCVYVHGIFRNTGNLNITKRIDSYQ